MKGVLHHRAGAAHVHTQQGDTATAKNAQHAVDALDPNRNRLMQHVTSVFGQQQQHIALYDGSAGACTCWHFWPLRCLQNPL
jgi:hypothetical protein